MKADGAGVARRTTRVSASAASRSRGASARRTTCEADSSAPNRVTTRCATANTFEGRATIGLTNARAVVASKTLSALDTQPAATATGLRCDARHALAVRSTTAAGQRLTLPQRADLLADTDRALATTTATRRGFDTRNAATLSTTPETIRGVTVGRLEGRGAANQQQEQERPGSHTGTTPLLVPCRISAYPGTARFAGLPPDGNGLR